MNWAALRTIVFLWPATSRLFDYCTCNTTVHVILLYMKYYRLEWWLFDAIIITSVTSKSTL